MKGGNVGDLAFSNGDEARSLRSGLANVPSLEIAGEHHVRPLVEDAALMNVAQGPVVHARRPQVVQGTGGVVFMPLPAAHVAVEQGDVRPIKPFTM